AILRPQPLRTYEYGDVLPRTQPVLDDKPRERGDPGRVRDHHVRLEPAHRRHRGGQRLFAARRAIDVEVPLEPAIERDLVPHDPARGRRAEAPVMERAHADAVAAPAVAAPARRVAPVPRLGVVADDDG